MTDREYLAANRDVASACETIERLPLLGLLAAQAQAETMGPLLDPVLYRRKARDFHVDMERARILRKAQAALESLRRGQEASP